MGFGLGGVWVMGYSGPMGYGMQFPANQLGGWLKLWDLRGYGLSGVWVKRDSTVSANSSLIIVGQAPDASLLLGSQCGKVR